MAVYNFRHCTLLEKQVLFTISNLVLNCGKLSYISWYITTFLVVFELVFYQTKMVHIFHHESCQLLVQNLPSMSPTSVECHLNDITHTIQVNDEALIKVTIVASLTRGKTVDFTFFQPDCPSTCAAIELSNINIFLC